MNTSSFSKSMTSGADSATSYRGLVDSLPLIFLGLWIALVGCFLYAFANSGWALVPR